MRDSKARSFNDFINESEEGGNKVNELTSKIQEAIDSVDDSLGYDILARAIANILNDSYGTHNMGPFIKTLVDNLDIDSINESEEKIVYPTNFAGMVQGVVSSIHSQVMAIARMMAEEKAARNPHRYKVADKIGGVEEVDITRALNLIFHSDWKNMLKSHNVQQWAKSCVERASKHDDRSDKKNQRALRSMGGQEDNYNVNLGKLGYSRDAGSDGPGSNQ